jgi:CRISPR-associated DxTHG motif protein
MVQIASMGDQNHLLIGSIGTTDYDEVDYELDGRTITTDVSPAALSELCDIGQALIFRTPEAGEKNDHRLREAFSAAGVDFELIDIGLIEEQEDVNKILQRIVDTTRSSRFREDSIILDISHSFRSIPIVFLLSVMQLTSLYENAALKKIYYSRFAGSSDHESSPVIDMTYLRTMIEWYDAFEMADQNGTYREIRVLLEERKEEIWTDNESHPEGQNFSKAVGQFGAAQQAIDAGFPLEAGLKANVTLESISGLDEEAFVGPEGMVLNSLERLLNGFDTDQDVSDKSELTLDENELRRQAHIVQYYVDNDRYWIAIECARELMINRFLYDAGLTNDWLEHDNRARIAPAPGDKHEQFTHDVDAVQALWDQIRKARNQYAHAGFKTDRREDEDDINQWIEKLCNRIDDDEFWNDK